MNGQLLEGVFGHRTVISYQARVKQFQDTSFTFATRYISFEEKKLPKVLSNYIIDKN